MVKKQYTTNNKKKEEKKAKTLYHSNWQNGYVSINGSYNLPCDFHFNAIETTFLSFFYQFIYTLIKSWLAKTFLKFYCANPI